MNKIKTMLLLIVTFSSVLAQEQAQQQTQEQGRTLEEITVEADMEGNYSEKNSSSAMKSKMPLLNTPQSVQVFNRNFLDDTAAQTTEQVLNYASGVKTGREYISGGGFDRLRIRGFVGNHSYVDGLKFFQYIYQELYGVEKIEVLKGPASSLYGSAPIGGVVNYTTKNPKPEDFVNIRLATDSYGSFEQGADIGFTNQSKNLYFRLVALNRNRKNFVKEAYGRREYIAPSLTWDITKNTKLTLLSHYRRDKRVVAMSLPAKGTVQENPNGKIPIDIFIGSKNAIQKAARFQVGYQFQHRFADWVGFRQNATYLTINPTFAPDVFSPKRLEKDNKTLLLSPFYFDIRRDQYLADTMVDFDFTFLDKIKNNITLGFDFYFLNMLKKHIKSVDSKNDKVYARFDLYNPKKNIDFPLIYKPEKKEGRHITRALSPYLQYNLTMWGFTLSLAGRYDIFKHEKTDSKKKKTDYSSAAFSPKAGLSYEFIKGFSTYINYSESFEDQSKKKDKNDNPLDPQKGRNMEAGLKTHAFNNKLVSTLAIYQLTKTNVALQDPATKIYTLAGEQRSRGVEFDVSLHLLPGLVSTFAYTFIEAKIINGPKENIGHFQQSVPQHSVASWIKYTIPTTIFKGLGFGMGGRYFSKQEVDLPNKTQLPGYYVLDAGLSYLYKSVKSQINFQNITNNTYFSGGTSEYRIAPGAPFNVRASVTASF